MSGIQQMLLGGGDVESVTIGTWVFGYTTFYGYANQTLYTGGSISDGKLSVAGGAPITALYASAYVTGSVQITVDKAVPNSGWQTMTVTTAEGKQTVYKRSEATYSSDTTTTWSWTTPTTANDTMGQTVGSVTRCVFA